MKKSNEIAFPLEGICGSNILNEQINNLDQEVEYCLKAIMPADEFLRIKLIGQEETNWSFSLSLRNGWFIFSKVGKEQTLKMDENSKAEAAITFNGKGKVIIEFYKGTEVKPFVSRQLAVS